jgi:hypothetical protein
MVPISLLAMGSILTSFYESPDSKILTFLGANRDLVCQKDHTLAETGLYAEVGRTGR